jgi:hypothetical protein
MSLWFNFRVHHRGTEITVSRSTPSPCPPYLCGLISEFTIEAQRSQYLEFPGVYGEPFILDRQGFAIGCYTEIAKCLVITRFRF